MKKKKISFGMNVIFIFVGALLAIAAFCVAFGASIVNETKLGTFSINNIIFKANIESSIVGVIELDEIGPSVLSFIGAILVLACGLGAIVLSLFNKKGSFKWIIVILGVLAIAGGIFIFLAKSSFIDAYATCQSKTVAGKLLDKKDLVDAAKVLFEDYKINICVIISGIAAILGGISIVGSQFTK